MTKSIFNFVLVNCLLISLTSCGQKSLPYFVDSAVGETVDENIKATMTQTLNAIKSVVTTNDSIKQENFGFGKNLDAITDAHLINDTIYIASALAARDATFGYRIILTRQNCVVKYFSVADEEIFKVKKNNKPGHQISVECSINKLTLSQKLKFEIGEPIEGIIELVTNDYWSVRDNVDTKIKQQLTGYFKTTLKNANTLHIDY